MKKIFSCLFIGLFTFLGATYAQVTIGSGYEPNNGSLLQLKEKDDGDSKGGVNASKGLNLPRVSLTDGNNLYPMFLSDPADPLSGANADYSAKKADIDKTHIGLMVYNINNTLPFIKGLYTWNGTTWVYSDGISPWHVSDMEEEITATQNDQNIFLRGRVTIGDSESDESAILKVTASNKGVLLPQVSLTASNDITTISNPAAGLLVYNTGNLETFPIQGYMYWNGTQWRLISTSRAVSPDATLQCREAIMDPEQVVQAGKPLIQGTLLRIPYILGNRGIYQPAVLPSTDATSNVRATISKGLFDEGSGFLTFNIEGTPTANQVSPTGITFDLTPFYEANPTINTTGACNTVTVGLEVKANIISVAAIDNLKLSMDGGVKGYATQVTSPDGKFSVRAFIVDDDFNSEADYFGTDSWRGINLQIRNNTTENLIIAGQYNYDYGGSGGNGSNKLCLQPGHWSGDNASSTSGNDIIWANYVSHEPGATNWSSTRPGGPDSSTQDYRGDFVHWGNDGIYAGGQPERRTYSWMVNDGAMSKTAYVLTFSSATLHPFETATQTTCPNGVCEETKVFLMIDQITAP